MKTIPQTRFLLAATIGLVAFSLGRTADAQSVEARMLATESPEPVKSGVPVRTLTYHTNRDHSVVAEEVRWGRRFGPPYRSYYFNGPARYQTYYPAARYRYRPSRSLYNYPGYYGRGYYGDPYGGVRVGRFGVYWR